MRATGAAALLSLGLVREKCQGSAMRCARGARSEEGQRRGKRRISGLGTSGPGEHQTAKSQQEAEKRSRASKTEQWPGEAMHRGGGGIHRHTDARKTERSTS